MNLWTLIFRSLRFYARAHLGVLLGATVGSAALIGALVVGDSVRLSLREMALARLGKVELAMASGDRFFRAQLGGGKIAAAVQLSGVATVQDGSARANSVQILGVDSSFWSLANEAPTCWNLPPETVILNQPLASQLKAKMGDTILLRLAKPSLFSRDTLISPQSDAVVLKVKVEAVATDEQFGRFSLQANQVAPFNAFVNRTWLEGKIGLTDEANLLLVPQAAREDWGQGLQALPSKLSAKVNIPDEIGDGSDFARQANIGLSESWHLTDAELELRQLPDNGGVELRSRRVFLDPPVVAAAKKIAPGAQPLLTYFVNDLRSPPFTTPYSMVTAMGAPVVPPDMHDDEILINDWLAEDLQTKPGETVALKYYVIGNGRALEERTQSFRIHGIIPMTGVAADRGLMPDFPGLADADSSSDWDAGFAIDLKRIRPKDEQYWKQHRGTPKAFITLAAGRKLWANRFGDTTAMRFPPSAGSLEKVRGELLKAISPASVGLSFQPVRAQALAASANAVDFGGLFIGFSLFLIVAALLLMALLFQFSLEARAREIGTLLALGFRPRQVRRLFLGEGTVLALIGGIIGAVGGVFYAKAMLLGLATIWRGAVGTSSLRYHATPSTLITGTLAAFLVSVITIWFTLRRQGRRPARELLASGAEENAALVGNRRKRNHGVWIGPLATLSAFGLLGATLATGDRTSADTFFSAGALLLIGGLEFCAVWLASPGTAGKKTAQRFTLSSLGWRGCGRRRKRSLATIALLASGVFLIVAIGAFRIDANQNAHTPASGTGGFELWGESALPVTYDLNSRAGQDFYGLTSPLMKKVRTVAFRVHDGDEASCLNLNHAQTPRLWGVNPHLLKEREAFTFTQEIKGAGDRHGWELLKESAVASQVAGGPVALPGEIPAIGDENSILWAMGKKVGDTLDYTDEQGRSFKVRIVGALANSILQGGLIIDEDEFVKRFPSESGYRMFLFNSPAEAEAEISALLTRALQNAGLELTPAVQRLNEFNAVQNTYLSTFQVLGGLGLLLGSVGLGVIVLRNVQERRGELALLLAVGFRRQTLHWLVLGEHSVLLGLGLAVGILAAALGVLPALLAPGASLPVASMAITLGAVLLNGLIWTWVATRFALRGKLIDALKNE